MAFVDLVLRGEKGSPLTNTEGDANFSNLDEGIAQAACDFFGAVDPAASAVAGMTWADLASGYLKRRNAANNAWVIEGVLFRKGLVEYPDNAIPTENRGPIYVTGTGMMEWNADLGVYVAKAGGATGGGSDQVFYLNSQIITTDYTVAGDKNAMSAGPIEIAEGVEVTLEEGSTWTIV